MFWMPKQRGDCQIKPPPINPPGLIVIIPHLHLYTNPTINLNIITSTSFAYSGPPPTNVLSLTCRERTKNDESYGMWCGLRPQLKAYRREENLLEGFSCVKTSISTKEIRNCPNGLLCIDAKLNGCLNGLIPMLLAIFGTQHDFLS